MYLKSLRIVFFTTILTLAFIAEATADSDWLANRFRVSGFGTLGVVTGGDEDLGFQRDWSRGNSAVFDGDWSIEQDSLLGLQLDARVTDNLKGAIQLVGRDRPDNSLEDSLEWAFLSYHLSPGTTVRGGRMGVDLFMLSEYRNVGFSYLWARPPVEFYGPIAFDNFDGMDITHTLPVLDGDLRLKVFGGVSNDNPIVGRDGESSLDLRPLYGTSVIWENNTWQARGSFAIGRLDSSSDALQPVQDYLLLASQTGWLEASSIAGDLELSDRNTYYYAAGIAYDNAPWQVQSEISYVNSEYEFFLPTINTYVSTAYQIEPVTLYVLASMIKTTEDSSTIHSAPPQWIPLQESIQEIKDSNSSDQTTLSFGLRWDIRYDLALKLQWDHHWVEHVSSVWFDKTGVEEERTLDTFSLNLNFIF